MSPVSSDPLSCLLARVVFHTRGAPTQFPPKPPPFPSLCLPVSSPSFYPSLLRGRRVLLMGGRKQVFGMELARVLGEVRNPGHPSCSL